MTEACHVAPSEIVAPSEAVANASLRIMSDLIALRERSGEEVAQIEAMGQLHAGMAFLRPLVGHYGVQRMLELAAHQSDELTKRDQDSAAMGRKRAVAAGERSVRS